VHELLASATKTVGTSGSTSNAVDAGQYRDFVLQVSITAITAGVKYQIRLQHSLDGSSKWDDLTGEYELTAEGTRLYQLPGTTYVAAPYIRAVESVEGVAGSVVRSVSLFGKTREALF
jgi:hypothetical protein